MSPSIYEWQGITLRFYSNDHEPVHVHAHYAEYMSIFDFVVKNGKVVDITEREPHYHDPLPERQKKLALKLIKKHKKEILSNWVDFYILHKKVKFKRIRGKDL